VRRIVAHTPLERSKSGCVLEKAGLALVREWRVRTRTVRSCASRRGRRRSSSAAHTEPQLAGVPGGDRRAGPDPLRWTRCWSRAACSFILLSMDASREAARIAPATPFRRVPDRSSSSASRRHPADTTDGSSISGHPLRPDPTALGRCPRGSVCCVGLAYRFHSRSPHQYATAAPTRVQRSRVGA
jgi:hypothetical protein